MNYNEPISKTTILVLLGIIFLGVIISQLNSYYQGTEIENHKIEVVGSIIDQYRTANQQRYIRYEYTFEGVTYQDTEPIGKKSGNFLHRYFRVYISEKKPDFSMILLDEEVKLP